jgi:hypothetical protein
LTSPLTARSIGARRAETFNSAFQQRRAFCVYAAAAYNQLMYIHIYHQHITQRLLRRRRGIAKLQPGHFYIK